MNLVLNKQTARQIITMVSMCSYCRRTKQTLFPVKMTIATKKKALYPLITHLQSCSWQFPWSYMHIVLCICVCVVKSWVMCYFSVLCQPRHSGRLAANQTLPWPSSLATLTSWPPNKPWPVKNAINNASSHDTHTLKQTHIYHATIRKSLYRHTQKVTNPRTNRFCHELTVLIYMGSQALCLIIFFSWLMPIKYFKAFKK